MNKTIDDNLLKQRNEKHQVIKDSSQAAGNAADQIIYVEEMVKTHQILHNVKHIKD